MKYLEMKSANPKYEQSILNEYEHIRISIGKPEEMNKFVEVVADFLI